LCRQQVIGRSVWPVATASTGKAGQDGGVNGGGIHSTLLQEQCTCTSMVAYVRRRVEHVTPEFAQSSLAAGVAG
jgi:hypothetical protein